MKDNIFFHTFSNIHKITDTFWNNLFKTDNKKRQRLAKQKRDANI